MASPAFDRMAQTRAPALAERRAPAAPSGAKLREVSRVSELFDNEEARQRLAQVAASHMRPERMMRLLANAVRTTPLLAQCNPLTLLGAFMTSASLGLEPNTPLGHAYLIPFKNNRAGTVDVQLIVGYKGLVDLARRSGHIVSIHADVVYEGDEFSFEYGSNAHLRHVPRAVVDAAEEPTHAYAHAKLKDGGEAFEVMPWKAVLKIRNESQGYKTAVKFGSVASTPWGKYRDEMAKKTAVRRLSKMLPLTIEMASANALDEAADRGARADFGGFAFDGMSGEGAEVIEGEILESSEVVEEQKPKAAAKPRRQAEAVKTDAPSDEGAAPRPEAMAEEIELALADAETEHALDGALETYAAEIRALPEALAAQVETAAKSRRGQLLYGGLSAEIAAASSVTLLLKLTKEHRVAMIARLGQLAPAAAEMLQGEIAEKRAELEGGAE